MSQTTNMQRVEQELIAEIQKRGLAHVLQWIGGWYDKTAQAEVEDDLQAVLLEHAQDPEARELHLLDHMLPAAESNTNFSTSVGRNLYRQSLIAARAKELNSLFCPNSDEVPTTGASRQGRRQRWEAWQAKRKAKAAASQ